MAAAVTLVRERDLSQRSDAVDRSERKDEFIKKERKLSNVVLQFCVIFVIVTDPTPNWYPVPNWWRIQRRSVRASRMNISRDSQVEFITNMFANDPHPAPRNR